jgi:histone H3/H4
MSKTVTHLNLSDDAKKALQKIGEQQIETTTKELERTTLEAFPDAKTLLSVEEPQLSLNRVKGIMGGHTDLKQSAAAQIVAKSAAENSIKAMVSAADGVARAENMKTIMAKHLEAVASSMLNGVGSTSYFTNNSLAPLVSQYSDMCFSAEAVTELRSFVEEELEELLTGLEDGFEERKFKQIATMVNRIKLLINQRNLKKIVLEAESLARERGKDIVDVEEICDAFGRL